MEPEERENLIAALGELVAAPGWQTFVLAPAIGGTVRFHATDDRRWDVEIASDGANVEATRWVAAALVQ